MNYMLFSKWQDRVDYSAEGPQPQPQVLEENEKFKVILAGLEPSQKIPEHPEATGVYHFLSGEGVMIVDGESVAVSAGMTLIVPQGASRGLEPKTRMAFLAVRVA